MGEEYDIDISEIDFEGNQRRARQEEAIRRKKQRRKELIVNIFEYILATAFILFMLFAPAIVEMLI